jgi:hypothetical protein
LSLKKKEKQSRKKKTPDNFLFVYESDCRREYVRVVPPPYLPVSVSMGGQTAEVINISAGGMACQFNAAETGALCTMSIRLPGGKMPIHGEFEILSIDQHDVVRGRYVGLTPDMIEAIHQYALEVQKEELRRKKEADKIMPIPDPQTPPTRH